MKKIRMSTLALALGATVFVTGCENTGPRTQGTATGAGLGALAGAAIGAMAGGNGALKGAAIGAGIGAIGGNLWSKRMEDQRRAMERATAGTGVEVTRTADDQLKLYIPNEISFATGSAALKPELREVLEAFASGLKGNNHNMQVRIVGHTDSTGSDAINNPLSQQRADSVKGFLVDRGVSSGRIDTAGRGSNEPVASNETAEGRAKNRRVEIFLREPDQGAAAPRS